MSNSGGNGSLANADIRLFESGNLADATIVCGDRTWKVHKIILSSRCKWFKAAFYGQMEAKSGKVVLEEQDADLIEFLLRFIYAKNIDIPKFRDGKDIPAFCIQAFRLGDFFLLDDLKDKATEELKAHIDNKLTFLDTETGDGQSPEWLIEVVHALEEAYKDRSTRPILETLLNFISLNKHKIFRFGDAVALLDKIPEMARDLMKSSIGDMTAQRRPPSLRLGLRVLAAVRHPSPHYELRTAKRDADGSPKLPCLLYPITGLATFVFEAVNPKTDKRINSLNWMTPIALFVETMTSSPDSSIVQVGSSINGPVYIRFDDCEDAKLYVERYCRANPEIENTIVSSGRLSEGMRRRLAAAQGRS